MQVNLSKIDLDLLEKALDAYESAPTQDGLMTSMFTAILPSENTSKEVRRQQMEQELKKAGDERSNRRRQATLLRAKLYKAAAMESKHDLSTTEVQS